MANALSDVVAEGLTPAYVERRAAEWEQRLRTLTDDIRRWLPDGWRAEEVSVLMDEEMMRQHHVPAREIPRLTLLGPSGAQATLVPYGLWVVGANGRLDLNTPHGKYVIVDRADSNLDAPAPNWVLAPLRDRSRSTPLTREALSQALTL